MMESSLKSTFSSRPGHPSPLGPTVQPGGTNFCLYSPKATAVELLLFSDLEAQHPLQTVTLSVSENRHHFYWHVFIENVAHGQVYGWRVHGPHNQTEGHLFDGTKVLIDPYAKAVAGPQYRRSAAKATGDNCPHAMRSVVIDPHLYDWEGDKPLPRRAGREIIYEMHLAAFTQSPTSALPDHLKGTFAGFIEKIPYLKELGITTVELLPIFHFDPQDAPEGLTNYWGYSTLSYFAPHAPFSSDRSATGPVDEFRDLVKALHRADLKVVLDVVFNHTAEGGLDGPTLSWRGLANSTYYLHKPEGEGYADFTGCGNTLNANHPVVSRMIQDSVKYWVEHMHVDGFRFDLASALTRGEDGVPLAKPPVIWALDSAPELAQTHLVAEAWDAAGLYQVGSFPGERFAQWNGPFRDDIRRFVRGDDNTIEGLMARLVGSPDIFKGKNDRPADVINFVTCHDGFTLADLVSYAQKHNLANGEDNRDGSNNNLSCNHGHEGPVDDANILGLRLRQMKNYLCLLFLSHGTPLLLGGDENGHTRQGNNNPWCQDNALNWFNWKLTTEQDHLLSFTRDLMAFTKQQPLLNLDKFWTVTNPQKPGQVSWHGVRLGHPDWRPHSQSLAFTLDQRPQGNRLHVILNSSDTDLHFELPEPIKGHQWRSIVDTSQTLSKADPSLDNEIQPPTSPLFCLNKSVLLLEEVPQNA